MTLLGCISKCVFYLLSMVILLVLLISIVLHLDQQFPQNLKHVQPQLFKSHPPGDLTSQTHSLNTSQYHHLTSKLIGKCQDFQLAANGDIYCVNTNSNIIKISLQTNQIQTLYSIDKGQSYGNKLSLDGKKLYFINSQLGLCEYNILQNTFTSLLTSYNDQKLLSLNSIEINPNDNSILYLTQSSTQIPMYLHTIDILLNNPFGRLFEFNINNKQLKLIVDGLYFPNGIVYQVYNGSEPTLLVVQTNRFRVMRVYLEGENKGRKQVAIDGLDLFVDNMKMTKQGDLWIAGPTIRDELSHLADYTPILRKIISRLPHDLLSHLTNTKYFGGIKITFKNNNKTHFHIKYYLYNKLPQFAFVTTIAQWQNKLIMSSLVYDGVFIVDLNKVGSKITTDQNKTEEL